jgi:hypothetical protein
MLPYLSGYLLRDESDVEGLNTLEVDSSLSAGEHSQLVTRSRLETQQLCTAVHRPQPKKNSSGLHPILWHRVNASTEKQKNGSNPFNASS